MGSAEWELPGRVSAATEVIAADHPDHPAHGLDPDDFDGGGEWPPATLIRLSPPVPLAELELPRRVRRRLHECRPGVLVEIHSQESGLRTDSAGKGSRRDRADHWLYRGTGGDLYSPRGAFGLLATLPGLTVAGAVTDSANIEGPVAFIAMGGVLLGSGVVMDLRPVAAWHGRQRWRMRAIIWMAPSMAMLCAVALAALA